MLSGRRDGEVCIKKKWVSKEAVWDTGKRRGSVGPYTVASLNVEIWRKCAVGSHFPVSTKNTWFTTSSSAVVWRIEYIRPLYWHQALASKEKQSRQLVPTSLTGSGWLKYSPPTFGHVRYSEEQQLPLLLPGVLAILSICGDQECLHLESFWQETWRWLQKYIYI